MTQAVPPAEKWAKALIHEQLGLPLSLTVTSDLPGESKQKTDPGL